VVQHGEKDTMHEIDVDEARTLAREAYVYGFPVVEGYRTLYKQAVDVDHPDFRAPFNEVGHATGLATPDDTQFVTPNIDTPYSYLWADLRAEPIVITMPAIEPGRYYTGQLVDLFTHNVAYLGTRTYGNDGGSFLVVGPGWQGQAPEGVRAVVPCETALFYVLFRVQLFGPADMAAVHAIQTGITAQTLSRFLGRPAPPAAPAIAWPPPVAGITETPVLFRYLNFLLQFAPTHPSEVELMARFALLGIGPGQVFDDTTLPPPVRQAVADGIADAWQQDFASLLSRVNAGQLTSANIFGTREFLNNSYPYRMLGAKMGLYGNSADEAVYPPYFVDADNAKPDASQHRYVLRFEQGQLPPAQAFWSLSMYDGRTQLLVRNPLGRYILNSTMLEAFTFEPDGSLILYLQKDSPGDALESNWLPAPDGPFYAILRIYLPLPSALDGTWTQPPLQRRG
jgi:hypothetical protein